MKINLSRMLLSASLVFFLALSCKKELSVGTENTIENAKSWYLGAFGKSTQFFTSSSNTARGAKQEIAWEKAHVYGVGDTTEIVGVPVNVTLVDGKDAKGSYMLFIAKLAGGYSSLMAYHKDEGFFAGSITNQQAQKLHDEALEEDATHKKPVHAISASKSHAKQMGVDGGGGTGGGGNCIDWYWTVYAVDDQGNPLYIISEQYLYTTCDDEGGGGGPDPDPEPAPFVPDYGYPTSFDLNAPPEEDYTVGIDSFKVQKLRWKFHQGYTWWGESTERGAVKINGGARRWDGLTHVENIRVGSWALGDVAIFSTTFTAHLIVGSTETSSMQAKYRIRLSPNNYWGDSESEYMYSYCRWNVDFQKVGD